MQWVSLAIYLNVVNYLTYQSKLPRRLRHEGKIDAGNTPLTRSGFAQHILRHMRAGRTLPELPFTCGTHRKRLETGCRSWDKAGLNGIGHL